jgi:hypothetical protein
LVPLLREVARLDTVCDRVTPMPFLGVLTLGVARQSANPSLDSTAFVLPTFFSFFSTSFCWILRLRAPLADMVVYAANMDLLSRVLGS